ncbi:hypothetical protein R5W60_16160 [Brucella pseudintermedia]|nr:hypothetical protein [Brucella pseudintermedia]WPM82683.1 hypothetical protein R5W60_16160 [Brucella pseudintermedia]
MSLSMREFRHRTTLSRSPSRLMRRWMRRKPKNEKQPAGDNSILCARSVDASAGLYAVVQDFCAPFAYPSPAFS